jgi:hypothetical protein
MREQSKNSAFFPLRSMRIKPYVSIVFALACTSFAFGQTGVDPLNGMVAPVDLYGNAQTLHPERRPLDIFQNETQRQTLGGYQAYNRQINQRGFGSSFALPADQFMKTMAGRRRPGFALPGAWQQRPNALGLQEREKKSAFSTYGGFGHRRSTYVAGDAEGVFARKRSLISATGSTAPIERSKLNRGALGSTRFPIAQTPFQAPQPATADSADPATGTSNGPNSLSRFLTSESQVLHDRALSEGWKQFEAGDYRAAIRTFESAAMLDEKDAGARIGAIFGYVSIGSFRSAYASFEEMRRRDPNVFAHDFSMTARFGDLARAQQVRLSAQGMAESSDQSAEMKALAVLVLWYMDGRDDALRAAKLLAGSDQGRSFSDWPGLMQAALNRPPPENP